MPSAIRSAKRNADKLCSHPKLDPCPQSSHFVSPIALAFTEMPRALASAGTRSPERKATVLHVLIILRSLSLVRPDCAIARTN